MRRRPTLPLKHNHGKSGHPGCQSSAPAVTRNPCFYDLDATCLSLLTYTNLMESICAALPARAACPCAELLGNRYWVPLRGDGSVMTLCLDVQIVADSPPVFILACAAIRRRTSCHNHCSQLFGGRAARECVCFLFITQCVCTC